MCQFKNITENDVEINRTRLIMAPSYDKRLLCFLVQSYTYTKNPARCEGKTKQDLSLNSDKPEVGK